MHNYADKYKRFPAHMSMGPNGGPAGPAGFVDRGWVQTILPEMEQGNLYNLYDFNVGPFHINNQPAVRQKIATFECPSSPGGTDLLPFDIGGGFINPPMPGIRAMTADYRGNTGYNTPQYDADLPLPTGATRGLIVRGWKKFGDISDGTSNTIAVFEAAGRTQSWHRGPGGLVSQSWEEFWPNHPWAQFGFPHNVIGHMVCWAGGNSGNISGVGTDGISPGGPVVVNGNNLDHGFSFHTGGIQVALCDGSVHFISENIDPLTFLGMHSINGGEIVNGATNQ